MYIGCKSNKTLDTVYDLLINNPYNPHNSTSHPFVIAGDLVFTEASDPHEDISAASNLQPEFEQTVSVP